MSEVTLQSLIRPAAVQTANRGKLTTIFGDAGIGKSTLAARCFPNPLFIPVENGLLSIEDVNALPVPDTSGNVKWYLEQIRDQLKEGAETGTKVFTYDTVVLDSVSELDTMINRELCIADSVNNINEYQKGFGKGQAAMANAQREIKELCNEIVKYGVHVTAISHAEIKTIEPPDGESYSRWVLQLVKGSAAQWLNQVDAVIHIREALELAVQKDKRTVATARKNQRTLDMTAKPSSVSKNRFGIQKEITLSFDPETGSFTNPLDAIYKFTG